MRETIEIPARFNGPPGSGNGGYSCGLFAALIDAPAVKVRLSAPPPLNRPLDVIRKDLSVTIVDGDQLVGQVWAHEPLPASPPAPTIEVARRAAQNKIRVEDHPYPGCFVCGPARAVGDGLRLFVGPLAPGQVAGVLDAPYKPAEGNCLPDAICWAALDCPGAYTFELPPQQVMLLGELTVQIHAPAPAGEPLVVAGWHLKHSGRKHLVGTALYLADGRCLASGRATWVLLPRPGQ